LYNSRVPCLAGPMPPARPGIGFVFPRLSVTPVSHNPLSPRHLSFIWPLARLALFRTIALTVLAGRLIAPRPLPGAASRLASFGTNRLQPLLLT
jgi:hypothetical protein